MIYISKKIYNFVAARIIEPREPSRLEKWHTYNDFIRGHNPFTRQEGWFVESAFLDSDCQYAHRNRKIRDLSFTYVEGWGNEIIDIYDEGMHCALVPYGNDAYIAAIEEYGCFSNNEDLLAVHPSFNTLSIRPNGKLFYNVPLSSELRSLRESISFISTAVVEHERNECGDHPNFVEDGYNYVDMSHVRWYSRSNGNEMHPSAPATIVQNINMISSAPIDHNLLDGYEVHTTRETVESIFNWFKGKWRNWQQKRHEKNRIGDADFPL